MGSKLIRSHKRVNDNVVVLGSEAVATAFYKITKLYNEQMEYKDLELTKQSLWEISGYKGEYNSIQLKSLIKELTDSKSFDITSLGINNIQSISGSLFVTTVYTDGRITIEVPTAYRHLLFYKKDINLMSKAKKKEKMSIEELDYYDREVKEKSKFLVLLNEADLLNIKGKYNKRLYALLKQWDSLNKYEKDWSLFKDILEIPRSYSSTDIDKQILKKAKTELLKANIKITKIEKRKKGRSIDKIRILFKTTKSRKEKANIEHLEEVAEETKALDVVALTGANEELKIKELNDFKREVSKLTKDFEIKSYINACSSYEEVNNIIKKYKLNEE